VRRWSAFRQSNVANASTFRTFALGYERNVQKTNDDNETNFFSTAIVT
jgi:hypothetical protein